MLFRKRSTAPRRAGLSLLEVLAALAIFLTSLIAIGRLLSFAGDRALEARQQGQAMLLCQAKLADVIAGVEAMTAHGESPLDEDADFQWAMECTPGNVTGLQVVKITVSRARSDGSRVEAVLTQMVVDPSQRGSAADASTATATGMSQ